ncbi:MAG: sulfurtransferase TusA family protein [Acidiferrobacteraceae bacterium]
MWPFRKKVDSGPTLRATSVTIENGTATIDVTGQTCPGYLLAINKAFDALDAGTTARLVTTYSPCGDDVEAYCKARGFEYLGASESQGAWVIRIRKPIAPA